MQSDINGVSACPVGEERYEEFRSTLPGGSCRIQYDYRTTDGSLFSCVTRSLSDARALRDAWLLVDTQTR